MDGDMLHENQTKKKAICTDNDLLWGGKAYSFGDFICYLSWHASHVQNTRCSFTDDGLTALTSRNVNFHNCLVIWKEQEMFVEHIQSPGSSWGTLWLSWYVSSTPGNPVYSSQWKSSLTVLDNSSSCFTPTHSVSQNLAPFSAFGLNRKTVKFPISHTGRKHDTYPLQYAQIVQGQS